MPTITFYGSSVADASLTTACDCSANTGGTETSKQTTIGSTTNLYCEVWSQGGTETSFSSLQSPTGHGWLYKLTQSGSFATGNWQEVLTLQGAAFSTVDITIRYYYYNGSAYTSIGTINKTGITNTKTTYTFTATSMSGFSVTANNWIYKDLWIHDTGDVGGDNPTIYESNSATAGVASDMQTTTSTFTANGGLRIFDGLGGIFS